MKEGYISVHRKILDWGWFQDSNTFRLFIFLLLTANFETKVWQGIEILPGQVVVGRKKLAEKLGLSEQEIRTSLNKLKTTNEITIKTTNRFSIITICKWVKYQQDKNRKQPSKQLTRNHQATTTKECKEDNKIYTTICDFYREQVKVAEKYLDDNPDNHKVKADVDSYKEFVLILHDWKHRDKKDSLGNSLHSPLINVLGIPKQLKFLDFIKHYNKARELNIDFYEKIKAMENRPDTLKKRVDFNLTLENWIKPYKKND